MLSRVLFLSLSVIALVVVCAYSQTPDTPGGKISLINAYVGAAPVDLYQGTTLVHVQVQYATVSTPTYRDVGVGVLPFSIKYSSVDGTLDRKTFVVDDDHTYTIVLHGRRDAPSFVTSMWQVDDSYHNRCPRDSGTARVRLCHAAPGMGVVDLIGTLISAPNAYRYRAKETSFEECSVEFVVAEGTYAFQLLASGVGAFTPLLTTAGVFSLQRNRAYTLYLIGSATETATPLRLLLQTMQPCAAPVPFPDVHITPPGGAPINPNVGEQITPVPFTQPTGDVAPYQPVLPPPPVQNISIIRGPTAPLVIKADGAVLHPSSSSMMMMIVMCALAMVLSCALAVRTTV